MTSRSDDLSKFFDLDPEMFSLVPVGLLLLDPYDESRVLAKSDVNQLSKLRLGNLGAEYGEGRNADVDDTDWNFQSLE